LGRLPHLFNLNPKMARKEKKVEFQINTKFIWLAIIAGIIIFSFVGPGYAPAEITKKTFIDTILVSGDVDKVQVITGSKSSDVLVYIKSDRIAKYQKDKRWENLTDGGHQFEFKVPDASEFSKEYDQKISEQENINAVPIHFKPEDKGWTDILLTIFPFLLLVGFWIFISRRMTGASGGGPGGGIFSIGKSGARLFDKETDQQTTLKDVAGMEEAKVEIMETVDFLRNPKKYTDLGGKIPKGVLLVGPPGTGKTLLARAVAGEANVPFFSISGSSFVEMFVGVGASRVRDLFKMAKEKAPCIVFIDEIDAIGRSRSKNPGFSSNDERESTLNQLLTEMDGFETNSGVILFAATNRVDMLDKALIRSGRFDRQIQVDLPEIKDREAIFKVYLKKLKLEPNMDCSFLARQTPGFSGADIANVCNEAALIAARNNHSSIVKQDFLDAIDRIVGGLERKTKIFKPKEKRSIAFHEAGHATVSWFLEYANPLIKVTIIPRGKALGAAWYLPDERNITTKEQMIHELASLLGGRASEELTFGDVSSGALNDLERATKLAYAMVSYYGMGQVTSNTSYFDSTGEYSGFSKPYSEKTAEAIDKEAKEIIDNCYKLASDTLKEHKDGVEKLANLLLEKEVVFTEDLVDIFGPRPGNIESMPDGYLDIIKSRENKNNESDGQGEEKQSDTENN